MNTCVRCRRQSELVEGRFHHLRQASDRSSINIWLCGDCSPEGDYVDLHIFNVACDRCGDSAMSSPPQLPTLKEFKAWGRADHGLRGTGRCRKCDKLCAACGIEITAKAPAWTPVASAGACSPVCALLAHMFKANGAAEFVRSPGDHGVS